MWTAQDVLADLLNSPEMNRRRQGVTMYDPDLARFGNAVSPFVQMPSYGAASRAMDRGFADRYSSRYDQPDATDWLIASLDQDGDMYVGSASDPTALWQKIDGVLKDKFGWNTANVPGTSRWYPPLTDGGFLDTVDAFRDAGATCTGDAPRVSCSWMGAKFVLLHDAEGSLRVFITDAGPFGAPHRTSGALSEMRDKTGIETRTVVAAILIVGTTGLMAARNPKYVLEISAAGAAGVALAFAFNAAKYGGAR